MLENQGRASSPSTKVTLVERAEKPITSNQINRLALVSHDYNIADSMGLYDYSEHFDQINQIAGKESCDTVLYALYTWHCSSKLPKSEPSIFKKNGSLQTVFVEVYDYEAGVSFVEVWQRGQAKPFVITQRFATSSCPTAKKEQFLDELPSRRFGDALVMLCGETNIASVVRSSKDFWDPYEFADRLDEMKIRLVLNPIHDYMRRYEMKEKRRYYSRRGRTVVSVWNKGKGSESALPWTVYKDGEDRTGLVRELDRPFEDRPDIRVGVVEVGA